MARPLLLDGPRMKQLAICPQCSGYVPESAPCPHCRVAPPRESSAMRLLKRSLKFVAGGAMTVTIAACYGAPTSADSVDMVEVTGGDAVVVGSSLQLTATATYGDGYTADATFSAIWTTNSAGIASVNGGLVTGLSPGTAVITATEDGVDGFATVTVSASSSAALSVDYG